MQIYDYNIDYKLPLPSQVSYAFCSRLGNRNGCLLFRISFLPPANEVWGKVIFLHLFVILFTGGEVPDPPRTRYTPGSRHTPRTRYTPQGPGAPPRADTPLGPGTPPQRPGTPPAWSRHTPGTRYTPQDQVHPPVQSMLGDMVNTQAVCILLECNLVITCTRNACDCHIDLESLSLYSDMPLTQTFEPIVSIFTGIM